jgi:hypothetical protein
MKGLLLPLLFFVFNSFVSIAQGITKPDIQYITLKDSILLFEMNGFINRESKVDSLFAKGLGYIELSFSFKRKDGSLNKGDRIDTVLTYFLRSSFNSLSKTKNTFADIYPNYYSFNANRLICINVDAGLTQQYFDFSEKSKRKLDKIVDKYLVKGDGGLEKFRVSSRELRIYFLRSIHSSKRFDSYVTEYIIN